MVDERKYFLQSHMVFTWCPFHATAKTAALFASMYAQIRFYYDNFTHIFLFVWDDIDNLEEYYYSAMS